MREVVKNKVIRWSKILAMLIATIVAVSAYQLQEQDLIFYSNGSNNFDIRISFFCMVLTILVTIEYWRDWVLRLIAGTVALMCINNYIDELLFNPLVFDLNEKAFTVLVTINLLHTIWLNLRNKTIQ